LLSQLIAHIDQGGGRGMEKQLQAFLGGEECSV